MYNELEENEPDDDDTVISIWSTHPIFFSFIGRDYFVCIVYV